MILETGNILDNYNNLIFENCQPPPGRKSIIIHQASSGFFSISSTAKLPPGYEAGEKFAINCIYEKLSLYSLLFSFICFCGITAASTGVHPA